MMTFYAVKNAAMETDSYWLSKKRAEWRATAKTLADRAHYPKALEWRVVECQMSDSQSK